MRFRQCMHALNYHTNSCSTTCRATWILRISASHYLDTDRSSALYFHPGESARWGERLLPLTPCESHRVLPCIDRSCFESNDLVRPPVLLSDKRRLRVGPPADARLQAMTSAPRPLDELLDLRLFPCQLVLEREHLYVLVGRELGGTHR
jgi:hypothetical protein